MNERSSARAATAVRGSAVGLLTFLLGYLLAYVTGATAVTRALRGFAPGGASPGWQFAPEWKVVGWLFYDAHAAGTHVPGVTGLVDLVTLAGVQYLYVVPPLLLVLAGGLLARLDRVDGPRAGLGVGMTVGVGYLLAVVFGLLLVGFVGIGPDPLRALVLAGVVYPVAFGAVGGVLAGVLATDRSAGASERRGGELEHARLP